MTIEITHPTGDLRQPESYTDSREFIVADRKFVTQNGQDIIGSEPDERLRKAMIDCRQQFVAAMGWNAKAQEGYDIADLNQGTVHMARLHEDRVATTMRLTPFELDRVRTDCLSLGEMLSSNPDMQTSAIEALSEMHLSHGGDIEYYDLTRLTTGFSEELHDGIESIKLDAAVLIGAGIRETDALRNDNEGVVVWTFCLIPPMKEILDNMGIQSQVIARGEVTPGDGYESLVCVAYPKVAYEYVVNDYNKFGEEGDFFQTYRHVTDGINS